MGILRSGPRFGKFDGIFVLNNWVLQSVTTRTFRAKSLKSCLIYFKCGRYKIIIIHVHFIIHYCIELVFFSFP